MLPNTWEPEAKGLPKIRSQPGLRLPKPKEKRKDGEEETLRSFSTTDTEAKRRNSLRHLSAHGHLLGWDLCPSCFSLIWFNTVALFPPVLILLLGLQPLHLHSVSLLFFIAPLRRLLRFIFL